MIAVLASFTLKQRLCKRKYTKAKVFVYVVFWRKRLHTLIKLKNMQKGKWAQSKKNATKMFLIRFHIQYKTDGKMSLDYTTFLNYLFIFLKVKVQPTLECLFLRPHTRQNLQRRQHQFSLFSSPGRSDGSKQKWWKGSQHTWQNNIWSR